MEYVLALGEQKFIKYFEEADEAQWKEGISVSPLKTLFWKSGSPSFLSCKHFFH